MLSTKSITILEPLVEIEFYQSSFYIQLANICNRLGYFTAEKYFLEESAEERGHGLIHYDFITGMGNDFQMPEIDMPEEAATSLYGVTELAKGMELKVTEMYKKAAADAFAVDQTVYNHLLQFIKIQVDAVKFYVDACAALSGLDKTGEMVVEKKIYK